MRMDFLHRRQAEATARAQQQAEDASAQLDRLRQTAEQASVVEQLVRDARYEAYRKLLDGALATVQGQLDELAPEADGVEVFLHRVGVLQGRIQQLKTILHYPDYLVELAEQLQQGSATHGEARGLTPRAPR